MKYSSDHAITAIEGELDVKVRGLFLGALASFGLMISSAHAGILLTSDDGYNGLRLDLSAYETGSYNFTFGPKPIPGGITFTVVSSDTNSGKGGVLGQGSYNLNDNGSFGGSAVYAAVDAPTGYMQFSFDAPVSSFGAYLNYASLGSSYLPPIIETIDSDGLVISSFNLKDEAPISTPGGVNQFEFRGIDEGSDIIFGFRMSNSYLLAAATGDGSPVGNDPVEVPEPGILALFGLSLIGLGIMRRRRND